MPKNINCITIIFTLEGTKSIKTEKRKKKFSKQSEESGSQRGLGLRAQNKQGCRAPEKLIKGSRLRYGLLL